MTDEERSIRDIILETAGVPLTEGTVRKYGTGVIAFEEQLFSYGRRFEANTVTDLIALIQQVDAADKAAREVRNKGPMCGRCSVILSSVPAA